MRVCDYIADEIYKAGAKDVFLVTGGGMMFLTDGLASHPKINAIPCHHEQAAAMDLGVHLLRQAAEEQIR